MVRRSLLRAECRTVRHGSPKASRRSQRHMERLSTTPVVGSTMQCVEQRDDLLWYSPSDLAEYLGCAHASALSRQAAAGERPRAFTGGSYAAPRKQRSVSQSQPRPPEGAPSPTTRRQTSTATSGRPTQPGQGHAGDSSSPSTTEQPTMPSSPSGKRFRLLAPCSTTDWKAGTRV